MVFNRIIIYEKLQKVRKSVVKTTTNFDLLKLKSYKYLDENKPICIFLDGKDVTKHHEDYNLLQEDGFTKRAFESAKKVAQNAYVFATMDEVSIVYPNAKEFLKDFHDSNSIYCGVMVLEKFLQFFWSDIRFMNTFFSLSVFNLEETDIEDYFEYRKKLGRQTAITWQAKEHLPSGAYHRCSIETIEKRLREHGLYEALETHPYILDGLFEYVGTPIDKTALLQR